ncbi:MAG: hypothetical protein RIR70_53 [Pseudomonadota bacterium]|jgi:DNA polymerase-3 subunit epsilon
MTWLPHFLRRPRPALDAPQAARLAAWKASRRVDLTAPLSQSRLVVVDVESSGLDLHADRLISIGAVAIEGARIVLADSFDVVLRQDAASSRDNILIHGIGGSAQQSGMAPTAALLDFLEYVGSAPLLAFHAPFDQGMVDKALRDTLQLRFNHEWADLAPIARAACPQAPARFASLDDWTAHFCIDNIARHSALGDALASAQLFLALIPALRSKNLHTFRALQDLSRR